MTSLTIFYLPVHLFYESVELLPQNSYGFLCLFSYHLCVFELALHQSFKFFIFLFELFVFFRLFNQWIYTIGLDRIVFKAPLIISKRIFKHRQLLAHLLVLFQNLSQLLIAQIYMDCVYVLWDWSSTAYFWSSNWYNSYWVDVMLSIFYMSGYCDRKWITMVELGVVRRGMSRYTYFIVGFVIWILLISMFIFAYLVCTYLCKNIWN